ncbi:unnamed protein product [Prorocentrum cordatum]|uniref:Kinesin motor domain-containing protein n=1 Tax=Prorocentrum cordatum TaxID=2364126 RepID=A0ABN9SVV2_9DINO|nr:unnamed protein product [Polarella glacialis]
MMLTQYFSTPALAVDAEEAVATDRLGHIRVAVRVRPLPSGEDGIIEVAGSNAIAVKKEAATGGNEHLRSQQGRVEERSFDRVFGPLATQAEVYDWTCAPLVEEAVSGGKNATVFVYGATGAGKTYTMFGDAPRAQQGVIFRGVRDVFQRLEGAADDGGNFQVKVSFLELYNESVNDLLQEHGGGGLCKVLEDERRGIVKVQHLREVEAKNADEALQHLEAGMLARTVEATAANFQSSRAHAAFTLTVERVARVQPEPNRMSFGRGAGQEARQLHSRICFIDLAGSERAKATLNHGASLKDGARINQSLLALANCIDALTARGREKVPTLRKKAPYRDSKLTLMLKSSLTGDGLVAMIANVHPGRTHFEDSNNTLEYAKRASSVRQPARRNSWALLPSPTGACSTPHGRSGPSLGTRSQQPLRAVREEGGSLSTERCIASSSNLPAPSSRVRGRSRRGAEGSSAGSPAEAPAECAGGGTDSPAAQQGPSADAPCDERLRPGESAPSPGGAPAAAAPAARRASAHGLSESLSELSLSVHDGCGRGEAGAGSPGTSSPGGRSSEANEEELMGDDTRDLSLLIKHAHGARVESFEGGRRLQHHGGGECACAAPFWSASRAGGEHGAAPVAGVPTPARGQTPSPAPRPGEDDAIALLRQVISTLQADKTRLDSMLEAVLEERDSLARQKRRLEQDNEHLRAASLEKDRQLATLAAHACWAAPRLTVRHDSGALLNAVQAEESARELARGMAWAEFPSAAILTGLRAGLAANLAREAYAAVAEPPGCSTAATCAPPPPGAVSPKLGAVLKKDVRASLKHQASRGPVELVHGGTSGLLRAGKPAGIGKVGAWREVFETDALAPHSMTGYAEQYTAQMRRGGLPYVIVGSGSAYRGWGQKWHAAREILERLPRRALVLVSDSRDVLLNLAPGAAPGSAAQRLAASFEALTAGALEGAVVAGAEGRCCVSALTNVRPGELFDEGGGRRVRACSSGSQGCPWRKGGVRLWEEFMGGLAAERGAAGTEVFLNAGLVAGCTNPTAPPPPHSCISAHSYW